MPSVLFTNSRLLLVLAREAADRAAAARAKDSAVATGEAIVAIVMAASAAECFINEFADVASSDHEQFEVLRAMADAVWGVEANKGSVREKFLVASSALGTTFPKDKQPWQDFATLIRLRNWLVHLRPLDKVDEFGRVTGPRVLKRFEDARLTYPMPSGVGAAWTQRISTDGMARWAYEAALRIIRAVMEMAPKGPSLETFAWSMENL